LTLACGDSVKRYKNIQSQSSGVAELAFASMFDPRDRGSNLNTDRKYFHVLFVPRLNPNLHGVNSPALFDQ
jgi:hypothetical protein